MSYSLFTNAVAVVFFFTASILSERIISDQKVRQAIPYVNPSKVLKELERTKVRLARTTEAIQIIKKLWSEGKKRENGFVDFKGESFSIRNAKLYTPPYSDKFLSTWLLLVKKQLKLLQNIVMD